MNTILRTLAVSGLAGLMSAALIPAPAFAANRANNNELREARKDAKDTLNEAVSVAYKMKADADLKVALQHAKGVFIVPNYGRAAVGIGGAGGEGVLITRYGPNKWSQPMFYNMGSISAGLQAGVEAGQIAMLLMTDKSVQSFIQRNNFSLNADAGLTVVKWSGRGQGSWGKGDVVMWSNTDGLFGDAAINVEDIVWDHDENAAYSGNATPAMITAGKMKSTKPNPLRSIFP